MRVMKTICTYDPNKAETVCNQKSIEIPRGVLQNLTFHLAFGFPHWAVFQEFECLHCFEKSEFLYSEAGFCACTLKF